VDRHQWDERYATDELIWRAEPNRFLADEVRDLEPGRALDLASGEGRNAVWLAEAGWDVVAVDFSAVGLAKARRLAAERAVDVEWIEADVVEWSPPAGSFDLVVIMYLHLPAAERRRVLDGAARALVPGGVLLAVGHDSSNLTEGTGGPQDPTILYSPDDLAADVPGLRVERADRVHRPVATEQGERQAVDALLRAVRED